MTDKNTFLAVGHDDENGGFYSNVFVCDDRGELEDAAVLALKQQRPDYEFNNILIVQNDEVIRDFENAVA